VQRSRSWSFCAANPLIGGNLLTSERGVTSLILPISDPWNFLEISDFFSEDRAKVLVSIGREYEQPRSPMATR